MPGTAKNFICVRYIILVMPHEVKLLIALFNRYRNEVTERLKMPKVTQLLIILCLYNHET